jgi:hypothetical protein
MIMNKDIEQAIDDLRRRAPVYEKAYRYYNGRHDLAFATEKFQNTFGELFREFALNLCPAVCDALKDKMRITGFSVETGGRVTSPTVREGVPSSENALTNVRATDSAAAARHIWQRNRMGTRAGEVHKEAFICGNAYMLVWPDETGRAAFYPNRANNITVVEDEERPGRILWAAKQWLANDKHIRLNIFYPDRVERYISRRASEGPMPDAKDFMPGTQASRLQEREASSDETLARETRAFPAVVPNPYGTVPVFHFANNAGLGSPGRSELDAAIPVQDGLNKSVLDMLVAMEFSAYRQRWAAGIEVEIDAQGKVVAPFKAGVDHVWIAENPQARFGDFEAAELEQFLKVKDSFRIDIASVTGTPLHYFLQTTGDFPSGESLKKAETRFLAKVRDRQESFGQTWADAMSFALRIEGHGHAQLITEWEDPAPMSEREVLENLLLKRQLGLSTEQALIEAGYGAEDVGKMVGS